jgi:hypothetical protein
MRFMLVKQLPPEKVCAHCNKAASKPTNDLSEGIILDEQVHSQDNIATSTPYRTGFPQTSG